MFKRNESSGLVWFPIKISGPDKGIFSIPATSGERKVRKVVILKKSFVKNLYEDFVSGNKGRNIIDAAGVNKMKKVNNPQKTKDIKSRNKKLILI